jgi:DNA-binding transcriptional MerR regulator
MAAIEVLTQQEVADLVRVSPRTLRSWCSRGIGPPAFRIGMTVRYHVSDVYRWLEHRKQQYGSYEQPRRPAE